MRVLDLLGLVTLVFLYGFLGEMVPGGDLKLVHVLQHRLNDVRKLI